MSQNKDEIEFWNGRAGERWVKWQARMDSKLHPFGEAALAAARLQTGERVLDVGCGCGDTSLSAASTVGPDGHVVGLDVSAPMLEVARSRGAPLAQLQFERQDAQSYLPPEPFDAIVSRFGVMFFEAPELAFSNLRRALKPGGRMAFACWKSPRENPWASKPLAFVHTVVGTPPPAPPSKTGPFAFADPELVRGLLEGAGFHGVALTSLNATLRLGDNLEDAVNFANEMGPTAMFIAGQPPEKHGAIRDALRAGLATLGPDFELESAVWIVTASA